MISSILFGLALLPLLVAAVWTVRFTRQAIASRIWPLILAPLLLLIALNAILAYLAFAQKWADPYSLIAGMLSLLSSGVALFALRHGINQAQDWQQFEAALKKENGLFRQILEKLPFLLVLKDHQSVYQFANAAYSRFLGKEPAVLPGKTDFDFFPRSQANQFKQEEERSFETNLPQAQEEEVIGIDGKRWMYILRTPFSAENGQPAGMLVSAYDITDRKQAEIPLQFRQQKLVALQQSSLALLAEFDKPSLSEKVLEWALRLSGGSQGYLSLVEPGKGFLYIQTATPKLKKLVGLRLKPGEDIAGRAWQSAQPTSISLYQTWPERSRLHREVELSAALGVPLLLDGQVIGVLSLFHQKADLSFSPETSELVSQFARIASQVLQNTESFKSCQEKLEENQQALTDLQQRSKIERLVTAMATHLINAEPEEIERNIRLGLQTIGQMIGADRSYIFLFSKNEKGGEVVGEWRNQGIPARNENSNDLHNDGFAWWMGRLNRLETVHIARLGDLPPEASETAQYLYSQGIKSFTAVPLISGRSVVGYLGFDSIRTENPWPASILNLLKDTGQMFVNALARMWATKELIEIRSHETLRLTSLELRMQESALITEMGDLLLACRTADEAYPIIARYAHRLLPGISGALYLIRSLEDPAENVAAWGDAAPGPNEHELLTNECWGLRRGRLHLVSDAASEPMCGHVNAPLPPAYMCVPMIAQGETVGLLHLRGNSADPQAQTMLASRQQLAMSVAAHVALALSNLNLRDRLRSQAIRDPLTGLFNRRYMEATLDRELRRASRHSTTVGVIMFDIDRMKPINDSLGHDAGDTLLKSLGALMLRLFRGEDVACRYGGDEFTIILPEASLSNTWQRAEQLREAFKRLDLEHDGKRLSPVTLSMGVGIFPDHGTTAERLLQASDAAAYIAKSEGGDRVMVGRTTDE